MNVQEQINDLTNRFYNDYFKFNPTQGRRLGFRQYCGMLPDFSYENIISYLKRLNFYGIEANRLLEEEELTLLQWADIKRIELTINYERFTLQQLRSWAEDPISYSFHLDITHYLLRSYASLKERAGDTIRHFKQVPLFLDQQRYNLKPIQSRINLQTTIEMYEGIRDFYKEDVVSFFRALDDPSLFHELEYSALKASDAVGKFIDYMQNVLLPEAKEEFAIGRFNYIDMLRVGEMVEIELTDLLKIGQTDLTLNRKRFREIAEAFMPGKTPEEVMKKIAKDYPSPDKLIDVTQEMVEQIRQFVINKDIVTVPSEERIMVADTPPFMRWAFALCDTPGPFEKKASESFYYITNVLPHWSEEKKREWMSKFDYATLELISVHETYPGHYVQHMHQKLSASKVSKIFGSYAFTEGWAHYTEEMMMEEGWHGDDPKYRLAQISEALVRNCRYICSIKMHTQKMTVDQATQFFKDNAFMEETPARKEAERGTYDPGYLNYTLGKLMTLKLREDWKLQEGGDYSLKRFHDNLLTFGSPPIPLLRRLMIKNSAVEVISSDELIRKELALE